MRPQGQGSAADAPSFPPHLGSLWSRAGVGAPVLSLPEMMAVRGIMGGVGGVGGVATANPSLALLHGFPPPFQLTSGLVPDLTPNMAAKFGGAMSFPSPRLSSLLPPALATPSASLATLPPPPPPPPPTSATPEPAVQGSGDQGKENPRPLKCINCEYVTTDMTTLLDHLDSHYSVRTFLCVHCTRAFPGPRELHGHSQPGQCPFREA
ncbi:WAS/WASL-interacting protein family member 3-like [Penaeus japonicus]|uniref:WAS/WASL-interacting protein family member 3-like n=1 Tax=Penaeus japonicus TaxID=27405 RepID=UPI001C711629|nr:WAS/WASL-interacting protein family member 3-like [Penaeus japonicus]